MSEADLVVEVVELREAVAQLEGINQMLEERLKEEKKYDVFEEIFIMQRQLNDKVFEKNLDALVSMQDIFACESKAWAGLTNQWLKNYSWAMRAELDELDAELLSKWWSSKAINIDNIRVELIDTLHFLVSAFLASGMTHDEVYDIYKKKCAVNHERQDSNYHEDRDKEMGNEKVK